MKPLEVLRAVYGMCELLIPECVSGWLLGAVPDRRALLVIRILGARHLVQAALTLQAGPSAHRLGGSVDVVHAASMVLLAAVDSRRRTPAIVSASIAVVLAAAEFRSFPAPLRGAVPDAAPATFGDRG